ncbi:MAG: response regulator [Limisphaerales bacterium]
MEENKISPTGTSSQREEPLRILVVDDDGDLRRLNTTVLIRHGYHVDAAEDGAVAWDILQLQCYDLLITDNNMPKVTGVELLQKLHAARMAMPVIMATGQLPEEELSRHPWLQPTITLRKPYTIEELLGVVKEVLHATDDPQE